MKVGGSPHNSRMHLSYGLVVTHGVAPQGASGGFVVSVALLMVLGSSGIHLFFAKLVLIISSVRKNIIFASKKIHEVNFLKLSVVIIINGPRAGVFQLSFPPCLSPHFFVKKCEFEVFTNFYLRNFLRKKFFKKKYFFKNLYLTVIRVINSIKNVATIVENHE